MKVGTFSRRLTLGACIRVRARLDDLVAIWLARIEQVRGGGVGLATCAPLVVPDDQLYLEGLDSLRARLILRHL